VKNVSLHLCAGVLLAVRAIQIQPVPCLPATQIDNADGFQKGEFR
jgi:hypothetical protein